MDVSKQGRGTSVTDIQDTGAAICDYTISQTDTRLTRQRRIRSGLAACACMAAVICSAPAFAQSVEGGQAASVQSGPAASSGADADNALGDIVVTATRRESRVQSTPIAISALDAKALERNNITDLTRLPLQVPSLFVGGGDGFGSTSLTIRGIGSLGLGVGADEGVGIYIDGVYQAKPYGNIFEFVDIDRVEVLRGPQGTLYGRNATGGAINIVTKAPGDTFSGQANAQYTNYNGVRVSGYVTGPLVNDTLSFKIAAGSNTRDGWAYDPTRREKIYDVDNKYVAAALGWRPDPQTEIILSGRAGKSNQQVQFKAANDTSYPLNIFLADYPGYERSNYWATTLSIKRDLGWASFMSISGYGHSKSVNAQDSDLTSSFDIEFDSRQLSNQFSQEFRLVSEGNGPFSWILGAQYFREKSSVYLPFQISFANVLALFDAQLKTSSYAAYAEGTYKLTDKLSVVAGLRYSHDNKHWLGCAVQRPLSGTVISPALCAGAATVPDSRQWGSVTPRFVVNYEASRDLLLYASATRGFRSGGWNFTDTTRFHSGFNPETIWSYEGGLKSELFNHRLRFNVAGFYSKYDQLQVRVNDGLFLATRNAGSARIYGIEVESNARLFDALDLSVSASYLNAKYTKFLSVENGMPIDLAGNYLNRAPKYNVSASAQYAIALPGGAYVTPRAEYRYTSQVYYSEENIPLQGASPYSEASAQLKFEPQTKKWSITAFADNIGNKQFRTHTFVNPVNVVATTYSTPRIYGVRAQFNW